MLLDHSLVKDPETSRTIWPGLNAHPGASPDRPRHAHLPHQTVVRTPELSEGGRQAPAGETEDSNLWRWGC